MSHSRLSPSGFEAWSRCPGKIHAEKDLPDSTSPAAQWGTDAHALLEWMLHDWLNPNPLNPAPQFDDQEEKLEVAKVAFDYVVERYSEAEKAGLSPMVQIEEKVNPEYYTGRDDCSGTGDVILETNEWLEVIDLKAGQGILVTPDSGQLKIYALGAMAPTARAHRGIVPMKEVVCTIVQPRIPHPDGLVRSETYTPEWLAEWCADELVPAANATDDPNAPRVPGVKQCQFCRAKATCKAAGDKVLDLAMSTFQPQAVDKTPTLDDIVNVQPETIPMEKLVEIIEAAPLITGWLKSVEAYARHRLENREPVEGYKLVRSGQRNKYIDDDEVVITELTKGKGRIPRKMLMVEKLKTAPQMLKSKDLSDTQRKKLQNVICKSEGSLALVPVTDRRDDAFPPLPFKDETLSFLN